jgi:hypothetical protein
MSADLAVPGPITTAVPDQLDRIEARLLELSEQVAADRAHRERWKDLTHELMPVAQGAMTVASRELEELSTDVSVEDLVRFARTTARTLPQLEQLLSGLTSAAELMHEVTSLAGAGMGSLSDVLATAERRGYFAAARHSAAALDRMVTTLDAGRQEPAPSAVALLRRLRDPQVRQGLARALDLLHELGADPGADTVPDRPTAAKD